MYQVSVPISVPVTKKKKFYLNLNQYRNAHHFTLSKAKINFHDIVEPRLKHLPIFSQVHLDFLLFTGSAQLCDTANICSIVDKFFSDVLVACQKIPDDNHNVVLSVGYRYGGIDKSDPRVEVTITPGEVSSGSPSTHQPKGKAQMQIIIDQNDIEEAIRAHVLERIAVKDNMRIDIDLKATRGDSGYTAIIDIVEKTQAKRKSSDSETEAKSEAKTEAKSSGTTKVSTPRKTTSVFPPATKTEAKAEKVEPKAEPEVMGSTGSTGNDDGGEPEANVETVAETAVEAPQEAPKKVSLFGNLNTPQNA